MGQRKHNLIRAGHGVVHSLPPRAGRLGAPERRVLANAPLACVKTHIDAGVSDRTSWRKSQNWNGLLVWAMNLSLGNHPARLHRLYDRDPMWAGRALRVLA